MKLLNRIAINIISIYQKTWGPIYKGIVDRNDGNFKVCNFNPTCSEYAILAFKKYKFNVALKITIYRLKRCNGVEGGYDPP